MINLELVLYAMDCLKGHTLPSELNARQIAITLALYRERGEFDGSLESAMQCLELSSYEVDNASSN